MPGQELIKIQQYLQLGIDLIDKGYAIYPALPQELEIDSPVGINKFKKLFKQYAEDITGIFIDVKKSNLIFINNTFYKNTFPLYFKFFKFHDRKITAPIKIKELTLDDISIFAKGLIKLPNTIERFVNISTKGIKGNFTSTEYTTSKATFVKQIIYYFQRNIGKADIPSLIEYVASIIPYRDAVFYQHLQEEILAYSYQFTDNTDPKAISTLIDCYYYSIEPGTVALPHSIRKAIFMFEVPQDVIEEELRGIIDYNELVSKYCSDVNTILYDKIYYIYSQHYYQKVSIEQLKAKLYNNIVSRYKDLDFNVNKIYSVYRESDLVNRIDRLPLDFRSNFSLLNGVLDPKTNTLSNYEPNIYNFYRLNYNHIEGKIPFNFPAFEYLKKALAINRFNFGATLPVNDLATANVLYFLKFLKGFLFSNNKEILYLRGNTQHIVEFLKHILATCYQDFNGPIEPHHIKPFVFLYEQQTHRINRYKDNHKFIVVNASQGRNLFVFDFVPNAFAQLLIEDKDMLLSI